MRAPLDATPFDCLPRRKRRGNPVSVPYVGPLMSMESKRPIVDHGERLLRWIARAAAVLALCWAAGGLYLGALLEARGVVAWPIMVAAVAPLWLLWKFAGEALGAGVVRRWASALSFRMPRVFERLAGGPVLLLLVMGLVISLAWLAWLVVG